MTEVLTFGETMAALHGTGPLRLGSTMQLSVAGSESNVAIGLARLGHTVEWVGRIGADELGRLVRRTLRAEGIEVGSVVVDRTAPTGALLFDHRIADLARVNYYRTGSAGSAIRASDVLDRIVQPVSVLHVTGVTAALGATAFDAVRSAVEFARQQGSAVSLDVNYRSRLWSRADARSALRQLLPMVDMVFASEDELAVIAPDADADPETAAATLVDDGVGTVIVTRGGDGASAYSADVKLSVPACPVAVADVVGAGDAFVAGYLSAQLDGLDIAARLRRGAVLGAFAVSRIGDWEALPTRDELDLLDRPSGVTIR